MWTTLDLNDALLEQPRLLSGIEGKTALVHAGLEAFIARVSAWRSAEFGGTEKQLRSIRRRRSGTRG